MLAGYITADGNVLTPILPAGSVVWVRARGEVFGRRPSAWADAETITLSQTPGLTIVELTLVENESAGCTPHLSWTPNAYAEGLRIRTSVGAFGHTPSYSLWDDVDSDTPLEITLTEIALDPGEEIYVEVTAYPTFSMGSVSGSPGSQYVLRESCEEEEEQDFGFLALNDTPDSYSGQGLKLVRVKSTEDGVEFVDPSGGTAGGLVGVQIITTTGAGTYTPTAGTSSIIIELQGGGGGGGGADANAAEIAAGGCGGGGGYVRKRLTADFAGASYSVGAGGGGGSAGNNSGTAGSDTTFTDTAGSPTTYTAGGGNAGGGGASSAGAAPISQPAAGGTATNGDINVPGGTGSRGIRLSGTVGMTGQAGITKFGFPTAPLITTGGNSSAAGADANGYGTGGGGALVQGTGAAAGGGDGADGLIIIWEYSS